MKKAIIGVIAGALSGVCTYAISTFVLAHTSAIVMPREFSLVAWKTLVVFGLGAFAVALVIHLLALRVSSSKALPSLAGFLVAIISALAISGLLAVAHEALLAWSLGALLASAMCVWLRSDSSSRRTHAKLRAA